jgi:hypothetical protein
MVGTYVDGVVINYKVVVGRACVAIFNEKELVCPKIPVPWDYQKNPKHEHGRKGREPFSKCFHGNRHVCSVSGFLSKQKKQMASNLLTVP